MTMMEVQQMKNIGLWDWMVWQVGDGTIDPFDYFRRKYGEPRSYAAQDYTGPIPDGLLDLSDKLDVPKGQVWISPHERPRT